jgi:hypothetical protein
MNRSKLTWVGLLITLFVTSGIFIACQKNTKEISAASTEGNINGAKTPKNTMATPVITGVGKSQVSISINVCAGTTGAPAGFSLQWMSATAYALGPDNVSGTADDNTWYASDDLRLCKASFSGNANLSNYNLKAGDCVTVKVGDFLFDNGASTNCGDELHCGVDYVFRAFAHATSTLQRSEFTANLNESTLPCGTTGEGCTLTQGYWKTHGVAGPASEKIYDENHTIIGYVSMWPVNTLSLGTVSYTENQLQSIFDTPAAGNGLIALAHQLIAAKLNVAKGADGTAIASSIAAADGLIGGLVIPPVGSGTLAPAATSSLITALANFNEGTTGPGHCD